MKPETQRAIGRRLAELLRRAHTDPSQEIDREVKAHVEWLIKGDLWIMEPVDFSVDVS